MVCSSGESVHYPLSSAKTDGPGEGVQSSEVY